LYFVYRQSSRSQRFFQIATFYQGDTNFAIESINPEIINGKTCFENVDANYKPDIPVRMVLFSGSKFRPEKFNQEIDLGPYEIAPFVEPVLAASEFVGHSIDIQPLHGVEDGLSHAWYATDLCVDLCYPTTDDSDAGKSVYMPFDNMQVLWISEWRPYGRSIATYNPNTGYTVLLVHQDPSDELLAILGVEDMNTDLDKKYLAPDTKITIPYDPNLVIAYWSETVDTPEEQSGNMIPHLHIEGQIRLLASDRRNWAGVYVDEGPERYTNCGINGDGSLLSGPCPPEVLNIALEDYLLSGYVDQNK
jgi:hypothetical protein